MLVLIFFNCPFNILFIFEILMQGTQIALQFQSSFQKVREDLFMYALEAIQKPIESSPNFLKDNSVPTRLLKNCERIPVYSSTNRRKSTSARIQLIYS